ncbi:MAG: MFS transporter, partial [Synergistetes bacterium]|nr:MFS transporter [Synergistota bacterium]
MSGLGIIAPLMPIYAKSLGVTGIWLGIVFSAFSISRTIFMPIIGRISDKGGKKIFLLSGLLMYSIVSILYTFATGILSLTAIRFIHGISSAMVIPIAMAYIGEIAPKGKEGSYMGVFSMSFFLGMGAGPFIGGTLSDAFGIKYAFYAMGTLTAIALINTLVSLPNIKVKKKQKEPAKFREMLKNNAVKGLFIFRTINSMGRGSISSFLPILA